jgi:serine/threonine protein kinase
MNSSRARAVRLCAVISFMQARLVAHCDLSLENVMIVARTRQVKVIDFALCVSASADGESPELVARAPAGKSAYISPEVSLPPVCLV